MAYYVPLPAHPGRPSERFMNIVDGTSTAVQRSLRRTGISGYEPTTVAAILAVMEMQEPGFTMFDVGANVGLYSCLCSMLFDPQTVTAFEPTPGTALVARKLARVNHTVTDVEELALGSQEGTAKLFLSAKSDASNSLVEGFKENVGTVEVPVTTLDEYVARSGRRPDIVKIDAETYEPEILRGARNTLEHVRPTWIVEVLHRKGHDHGEDLMDVIDGLGYHYYDISPYSEWQQSDRVRGDPNGEERDWLLTPTPLPPGFGARFEAWEESVAECTSNRNRLSLVQEASRPAITTELGGAARALVHKARKMLTERRR